MTDNLLYRMTPLEVAWGWVPGYDPSPIDFPQDRDVQPISALENVLRPALVRTPCLVAFSGGRDSSAVLAVAVGLARREGLELPIPYTEAFPADPDTHEEEWQNLVISHLELTDWERATRYDELDILGPAAQASLSIHGLVWPPTFHTHAVRMAPARGGSFVTGEGGDEILGVRRITPLTGLLAGRVHPRRQAVWKTVTEAAPLPWRRLNARRWAKDTAQHPWLTSYARARLIDALTADKLEELWWWDRGLRQHLRRRANSKGLSNLRVVASEYDVFRLDPLLEPTFVNALATFGGRWGFPGRAAAMEAVFGEILPAALIRRPDKAVFTASHFGPHSREFVRAWDGCGVDERLVQIPDLMRTWKERSPHAGSHSLLQAAWLAHC